MCRVHSKFLQCEPFLTKHSVFLFQCFAIVAVHTEEIRSSEVTSTASTEEFSGNSKEEVPAAADRVQDDDDDDDDDEEDDDGEEEDDDQDQKHSLSASSFDELARELEQVRRI
jgi:TATA-binding protein-associated factor Taf7